MSWHYAVGGQQKGPVTDDEFNQLVATGAVRADTLVWREGWAEWRTYSTVVGGAPAIPVDPTTAVCAVSGRLRPKSEMLEFEGRWVSTEHKEEFFQRLREGVSLRGEVRYAGFWIRVAAKIIDTIIVCVINFVVAAVLSAVLIGAAAGVGPESGAAVAMMLLVQVLIQIVGIALTLAYALYFTRKFDATPGKLALGLRLLRADGSKLSKGRIVGRYFSEWISSMTLLIGYIMVAFDKEEHRALHDRIADTRVIVHRP
ncbi:MAG: RDD family protein [Rariglobus sp.]